MTNVSLSRCVSFYSGQSRAKDSSIFIHWNPDFCAFSEEELTNEQGYWARCALVHSDYITQSRVPI